MFKVFKSKIPEYLIDNVLKAHEIFKFSKLSFFRAQGTNSFESPKLDKYNNQINSIQNPHLLGLSRSFRKAHNKIIFHKSISNALREFNGEKDHIHYQSMFFDKSTGTQLHQDTWYLDTQPRGNLVGVWIALEDININSGPFIVYTNTDKKIINPSKYDFKDLENDKRFKKDYSDSKKFQFLAQKGDLLIWDSFSIHGAETALEENSTRKSITSHFYPKKFINNDPPVKRIYSIYNHKNPSKTPNKKIFKAATINPYLFSLLCILLKLFNPLKSILLRDKTLLKNQKGIVEIRKLKN
tara:strand:- start:18 stop:908 length:891 start_codon:yes stop_codon:yes gene_type:complete